MTSDERTVATRLKCAARAFATYHRSMASERSIPRYGQIMNASTNRDPEHARLLGEAIIAWSNVSDRLEKLFVALTDLDDAYVIGVFVKRIKDAQMDDVVNLLAGRLEEPARDAIREWIKRVGAARKKRNLYLHSTYMPIEHSDGQRHLYLLGQSVLHRDTGRAEPNINKLLSRDMNEFSSEALALQEAFDQLLEDHYPFPVRATDTAKVAGS